VHAVAALAVTMSLAWLSFLSAVVLVLLILHQGPRLAALELAGAAVLLAVLNLLLRAPLGVMFGSALSVWAPAGALALLMLRTRSLTLTLQVAWLVRHSSRRACTSRRRCSGRMTQSSPSR
jgi:hypothetical protein